MRSLLLMILIPFCSVFYDCNMASEEKKYYIEDCDIYISIKPLSENLSLFRFGRENEYYTDSIIVDVPNTETQTLEFFVPKPDCDDIYILDFYKQIVLTTGNKLHFHTVHEYADVNGGAKIWLDSVLYGEENITIKLAPYMNGFKVYKDNSFVGNAVKI